VVVVVPCLVLASAWWLGTVVRWECWRRPFLVATAFGALAWAWLMVEVQRGTSTVIIDFARTTNPLSRAWRLLLPDLRVLAAVDLARLGAWVAVMATLAASGWRHAGPSDDAASERPVRVVSATGRSPV
jgi:hypothetical protein